MPSVAALLIVGLCIACDRGTPSSSPPSDTTAAVPDTAAAPDTAAPEGAPERAPETTASTDTSSEDGGDAKAAVAAPEVPWRLKGRIDMEGDVFALALGADGHLLAATRSSKQAALFWVKPDAPLEPPVRRLLDAHGVPYPLAPGVFGVLSGEAGELSLLKVGESLSVTDTLSVGGRPMQMLAASERLWVVDAEARDGLGLLGVDPVTGGVVERIETGPRPVEVSGSGSRLYMTTHSGPEGSSVLVIDLEARRRVKRAPVAGLAARVVGVEGLPVVYGLRYNSSDMLILDEKTGVTLGRIELGFEASTLVPWRSEEGRGVYALSGQGPLARLSLDESGREATVEAQAKGSPGSVELHVLEEGTLLLLLDRAEGSARWLDARTLETRGVTALGSKPGQAVVDVARGRLYVSLPQSGQVAVFERDPKEAP